MAEDEGGIEMKKISELYALEMAKYEPKVYVKPDGDISQRLDPPRWRGGPKICVLENMTAWESPADFYSWFYAPKTNNPNYENNPVLSQFQCSFCGQWHFEIGTKNDVKKSPHHG